MKLIDIAIFLSVIAVIWLIGIILSIQYSHIAILIVFFIVMFVILAIKNGEIKW